VPRFDRAIPPGGEGKITLQVNTAGFQGPIDKSARVYSNDPANGQVTLRLKAVVQVPILVTPKYVYLSGSAEKTVTRIVEVTAELDKPLEITVGDFNLERKVHFKLEEIEKGRKYRVRFESIPGPPQTYQGFLKLKTNYAEKPEMTIWIRGRLSGGGKG
jgi:hypothetical protein